MDEADYGNECADQLLAGYLETALRAEANRIKPPYSGFCAYCGDECSTEGRFCCADCAGDFEWFNNAQKRLGR